MQAPRRLLRFGLFELDLSSKELRKAGVRVRLAGHPIRILELLVERPGEVVSRDEIRQALWAADTFVDFEHNLNSAMKRLRAALGDSAGTPRFIETLPRRGYRFLIPVLPVVDVLPLAASPASVANGARERSSEAPPASRRRVGLLAAATAVMALAVTGGWIWRWREPATPPAAIRALAVLPFDSLSKMRTRRTSQRP